MAVEIHLRLFVLFMLSCTVVYAAKPVAVKPKAAPKAAPKAGAAGGKGDFESEAIKHIESAAANLPESAFSFDPILFQVVENSETKYRIPETDKPDKADIYTRKSDDTGKETVVLTSGEDRLEWKAKKRVYIVLRKNSQPKSAQAEYYTSVAYIRDSGDKDKDPLKISGGSYKIEWDLWEDHFVAGGSTMTLNSIFCTSSVIIPCLFSDTPIEDGKDGIVKAPKRYEPKSVDSTSLDAATKIAVDAGVSDDSFDMYRDIDSRRVMSGRYYGTAQTYTTTTQTNDGNPGVVGSVVKGVGGIMCSIFGGCNKKASSSTTTINIDATDHTMMGAPMAVGVGYNPYGYTAAGPAPAAYYGTAGGGYDPNMAYGRRKKREGEAATDVLDFPGWKTQYLAIEKGIYLKPETLPFYGFGNCPSKPMTDADLDKAKTGEELVSYYLNVLRSDCTELLKKQLSKLLEMGALHIKDKTLVINDEVQKANNPKFTLHETIFSQTALEMDAFTTTYIKHKKAEKPMTPDGKSPISRTVNLAVELILNIISKSRDFGRLHMIAKTRHAIIGCRYAFSKLAQDEQNMAGCADCVEDLKLNLADRIMIMGLMQYLKFGLRDIDAHNKDVNKSFKTFFTKNKDFITKKVNLYS